MAIYPKALKKLIPWANANVQNRAGTKPNVIILHVAVSNADSLVPYFSNIKNESCSHFYVRKDGTVEQYIDTEKRSVADREGNIRSISIETQGGTPVGVVETEKWTAAQLKSLGELVAWIAETHNIPLQVAKDSARTSAGVSYHRRGIKGNWTEKHGKGLGWIRGEIWSGFGKSCPGKAKILQVPEVVAIAKGEKPSPDPKPDPKPKKTVAEMATEVIRGDHGNGHANRQKSLGVSDAVYAQVRDEVNRRLGAPSGGGTAPKPKKSIETMATEVIAGKHGNGHANRQKSLGISKAEYEKVRAEVNRRAGASTGKSVSQMATEVIRGDHGNGHANRQKSLGVSNAVYQQVRAEVNRRNG